MTSAEIAFADTGETLLDRKHEFRKVFLALLAALFIHLVVAFALAAFGGAFTSSSSVSEEEKPSELTIVDLPAAPAQKNTEFVPTPEKNAPEPEQKTFESNANSIGASEVAPTGDAAAPSQEGKDRPWMDLQTQQYTLQNEGAQPQPQPVAQETPQPSQPPQESPQPTPMTDAQQFAMLTTTPQPTVQPSVTPKPQQPNSVYRPQKQQTRIRGNISNRGISSVNAVGTPLGRYQKILFDAVGSRWYAAVERQLDLFGVGTARINFWVDREGHIKNVKVTENSSNELFVNFCVQSIQDASLPPMSEDLAASLPPEGLEVELPFTIYAN